jgi:uncharacterized protein YggL (DUF469 family)
MNRRMRKKRRCGEYTELGFMVKAQFQGACDATTMNKFLDDFLSVVENGHMACGGFCNHEGRVMYMFVTSNIKRGNSKSLYMSTTEEQRHSVLLWCKAQDILSDVMVSELCDGWDSKFDI